MRRAACGLLLLAACERAPDPVSYTEPTVAVFSVVAAGSQTVGVLVTRFTPGDATPLPVSGAVVTFSRGATTLTAAAGPGSGVACFGATAAGFAEADAGCYAAAVPGGVRSGDVWRLNVRFPTGETAAGEAVVPIPPTLIEPAAGAHVGVRNFGIMTPDPGTGAITPLATLRVRWDAPADQPRTELSLRPVRAFTNGRAIPGSSCAFQSTADPELDVGSARDVPVRVYEAACSDPASASPQPLHWDSLEATLAVAHYDTAYARYVREVTDAEAVIRSHAAAGVHGALGLFAGSAPAKRTVMFVPAP